MFYNGAANWITETRDYDLHRGLPKKVIGADGLSIAYTYDAFDRVTTETAPYYTTPSYTVTHVLEWDLAAPQRYYRKWVQDPARPDVKTWYDLLGRATRIETEAFGTGNWSIQETEYDQRGHISRKTSPHFASEPVMDVQYTYDVLDRPTTMLSSVAGPGTMSYSFNNGLSTVTTTSPSGQVSSEAKDATGLVVSTKDDGGTLNHTYDSWGNLLTTKRGYTTIVSNAYDAYGRQTQLTDAAAGTTQYDHDAFGRLTYQKDAKNNITHFTYDNLGRLKTKEGTVYQYYYQNGRFSSLPMQISEGACTFAYTYDDLLRTSTETRTIDGENFVTSYTYDSYDNVSAIQYPSGVAISYAYAQNCFVDQIMRGSTVLFDAVAGNGQGKITQYLLGDGKNVAITYTNGLPTQYYAAGVQDLRMGYNYTTGNLNHRWDKLINRKESFAYDALDRLTTSTVATVDASGNPLSTYTPVTIQYDGTVGSTTRGQITWKTDVGKFNNFTNSNAVNLAFGSTPGSTAPAGISQATQSIAYDNYLRTATISEAVGSDAYVLNYTYGPDRQRAKSVLKKNGSAIETRIYCGAYEEQRLPGTTNKVHYISGPAGLYAMIVVANGVETIYYTYTDHLGSVTALTKKVGTTVTVVARRSYDPWGRERNATTWSGTPAATPAWLYRGFTGHEHVQPFGLINMNARMYDPVNGRMLAPDNYVNGAFASQAFNRYSYACNNPLKYTDPDGNIAFIDDAILGLIGGVANLIGNWGNIENVGQGFAYFGIGFVSGAVSEYITPMGAAMLAGAMNAGYQGYQATGNVDPGAMLKGAVISGAVSGLSMGLGNAVGPAVDKAFGGIASPVLRGSLAQGLAGAGIGAFGGGLGAAMGGGDFWEGAGQGAMMGLGTGLATGGYSGFLSARAQGVSPWTGKGTSNKLYRAVSPEEYQDIQENGVRPNPNGTGYQDGKLFSGSP